MPELPEVETVKRGIAPLLEGKIIVKVIKRRDKIRIDIPKDFEVRCEGQKVLNVERKAKYILITLESGDVIICHLGMSGRITLVASKNRVAAQNKEGNDEFAKHDHVIFETDRGDLIIYNDPRRFGIITICHESELADHKFFKDMGPEPLGNSFNGAYLFDRLKIRKTPIKNALLDQRVVVGLGNIYVCEALYSAGIAPDRLSSSLKAAEYEKLVPIIREILKAAIKAGGSTLKDYAQVDGELGYFQHSFKTYGREGEDCVSEDCDSKIHRMVQSGRSTFYCPQCQN